MSDTELSVKLDAWIDDNTVDGDFIAHPDFVYDKLLELETKIKKLQAENAELKSKLGLCANHLLLALNLDEIEDKEDKASIHAKANAFIIECDSKLKGL